LLSKKDRLIEVYCTGIKKMNKSDIVHQLFRVAWMLKSNNADGLMDASNKYGQLLKLDVD
jgi:hypothetical protein